MRLRWVEGKFVDKVRYEFGGSAVVLNDMGFRPSERD